MQLLWIACLHEELRNLGRTTAVTVYLMSAKKQLKGLCLLPSIAQGKKTPALAINKKKLGAENVL